MTEFIVEITPWISLRHTNVLRLLAMCPEPASLCIVTDLIPRGSLWDVLHKVRLPALHAAWCRASLRSTDTCFSRPPQCCVALGAQHAVTQERIALDHGVAVRMMRDLAAGVDYLHSEKVSRLHQLWRLRASGRGEKRHGAQEVGTPVCQVLHRDIKTANLLVGERLTLKLTDFGFAKLKANWCLPSACPLASILEYTTTSTGSRRPSGACCP